MEERRKRETGINASHKDSDGNDDLRDDEDEDAKVGATRPTCSLFRAWKVDRPLLAFHDLSQPPTLDVYYYAYMRSRP